MMPSEFASNDHKVTGEEVSGGSLCWRNCANIILGIIRHKNEHNFHRFSEKSPSRIICTFD